MASDMASSNAASTGLALAAAGIACRAALAWVQERGIEMEDTGPLNVALVRRVREALPGALEDAREAFACHMDDWGEATFAASLRIAGLQAVRDCFTVSGEPIVEVLPEHPEGWQSV